MKNPSFAKSPLSKIFLLLAALWLPHSVYATSNILVFGDSLSAGYGVGTAQSWVTLLQQELRVSHPRFDIVNASISGETTLGGRQRIAQALQQHKPVIVIVELGANDGLRGADIAQMRSNLDAIIVQAQRAKAHVLLVGMKLPPNYGEPYIGRFHQTYIKLARQHGVALLPFLLEGVEPEQFQADNLHPAAAAQPQIMRNVLRSLQPLL